MNEQEFKNRTKHLALRVIKLVVALPKGLVAEVIGRQLLRSATSVGANYRAACRGRSSADVVSKLGIVEEEADETLYWMELLVEAEIVSQKKLANLMSETNEILAMTVASIKTLRARTRIGSRTNNPKSKTSKI
ncbi:MAG TPA: four helix bundle protein [Blastocatellia bacterium]|nr:four helix bundle protein [Blastocatellia bacterium]